MSIYRIILAALSVFQIADRLVRFMRRERYQSLVKLVTVLAVWGSVFYIAVFPDSWRRLSDRIGLGADTDMLVLTGFIVVFLIMFRMLSIIEKIERNITALVRREALQDLPDEA